MMAELYDKMHKTANYQNRNQGVDCYNVWSKKLPTTTAGKSVIELGCGNGLLCKRLIKNFKKVTGVDIADGDYDRQGYEFVRADITRSLSFGNFDYCVCFDVLEHLMEFDILPVMRLMAESAKTIIFTAACYGDPPMHLTVKTVGWWLDVAFESCPEFDWQVLKVWNRYEHKSPVILLFGEKKEN